LTHNYACPGGELDLVALDGLEVVFVEVRSTSNRDIERTVASVNREKQRRISLAARHYLAAHRLEDRIGRFDVLIVCWPKEVQSPRIEHFPNAFSVIG
jgi:putative endonuclease